MSHHDEAGFTPDDYHAAAGVFADAITSTVDDPENLAAVKKEFYDWAGRQYDHGSFAVEVERLIADHLWSRVNNTAASTTRRVLAEFEAGKISLPLDAWLDRPMTVGQHRRILLRHYKPSDGERLIAERVDNEEKAGKSRRDMQRQVRALDALVVAHGSLPAAIDAGALVLAQPETAES